MARHSGFTLPHLLISILMALPLAAIILTNLQRGQLSRCEADGPWGLRMLITNEIAYSTAFLDVGYAPNLSVLGGEPGCSESSPERACLVDNALACSEGVGEGWCSSNYNSYRYNIQTSSSRVPHEDFWISASPTKASFVANDGDFWRRFLLLRAPAKAVAARSYCGADDGDPRVGAERILSRPFSKAECLALRSVWAHDRTAGD